MKFIQVSHLEDSHFKTAWQLYELAFPVEERRTLEQQEPIILRPEYHLEVILDNNKFIGFLMWWDFDNVRFIEYFATDNSLRNQGYGKKILQQFLQQSTKPVLLEVELPTSAINKRRIQFYERIGFQLNPHHYEIKIPNTPTLQFLLMTYPDLITQKEVAHFVEKYHPIIFDLKPPQPEN